MFLTYVVLLILQLPRLASTIKGKPALLVIDPFIDFLHHPLLQLCEERGIHVLDAVSGYTNAILSNVGDDLPRNVVPSGNNCDEISAWARSLGDIPYQLSCVLSESDVGISAAERIVEACNLKGNKFSPHLRSKYEVNEACRAAGLKVVSQLLTDDWDRASEFVDSLLTKTEDDGDQNKNDGNEAKDMGWCIVKPYRGVASDGVFLCDSSEQAKFSFEKLKDANTYGGGTNEKVLIQEFADGIEYAMDTVSMDGEVKVLALWKYCKVRVNGAPFVYQCTELVENINDETNALIDYCVDALRAAGVLWGPTHTEVKMTDDGPRLIEINCRWHSANFYEICQRCYGYDAISATLDAYFDPVKFKQLPDRPPVQLKERGKIVHLISSVEGTLKGVNCVEEISKMNTVIHAEIFCEIGEHVEKTIDIRTDCGYVLLCGPDDQVDNDYAKIIGEYQDKMLIVEN